MNIKLLKHQGLYIQAPERFPEKRHIFLVSGYGAGKTMSNVLLAFYWIKRLQGKKDAAGGYARIIIAGTTLTHLEGTFLIYFRQFLQTSKSRYVEDKKHNMFIIGTVTVMFVPLENPERLYGRDVFCAIAEEVDELTEDKMFEAIKALSERCRQVIVGERDPWLAYASTAQGQKGLYRIYNHFKKSGIGFVFIRGRTEDNIHLPKSQIEDLKKIYTPEESRVFLDAEFIAIAKGRVFGDFDWARNSVEYDLDNSLVPGETVYIGMDFNTGVNKASAYVIRKNEEGEWALFCIKAYDFPNPQDAPEVFYHDFPEQKILWIPDVTVKDNFPQYGRALRKYNIHIIYRKKSPLVEDTVFLVNKLFFTRRLIICRIAKDVAEASALFMRDKENKVPKGKGPKDHAHTCDPLRYVASFVAANKREFIDMRRLVLDKRASFRETGEALVSQLNGGYVDIDPEVYR